MTTAVFIAKLCASYVLLCIAVATFQVWLQERKEKHQ
jgi:hypothetical protein